MVTKQIYDFQEKALYDKQQKKLSFNGIEENNFKFAQNTVMIKYDELVLCPFCLSLNEFGKQFTLDKGFYKCLFCKNSLKKETIKIIVNMNPEEFARWVYDYRKNGFFKKIYPTFKMWNNRLNEYNYSLRFWNKYKELRGDIEEKEQKNE
jgi:hypothetical protein